MNVPKAWSRLLAVQELSFEARSVAPEKTGWSGSGKGVVQVEQAATGIALFHEQGTWTAEQGRQTAFTNTFRWTADLNGQFIRLEHLRFGRDHPVYLFDLVGGEDGVLISSEPHVCRDDLYTARMEFDRQVVHLQWTIRGPRMDEAITYTYR